MIPNGSIDLICYFNGNNIKLLAFFKEICVWHHTTLSNPKLIIIDERNCVHLLFLRKQWNTHNFCLFLIVPKKNDTMRFIQVLQPVNKVTIRNARVGPTIDKFAKAFPGSSIYSVDDLYSGYDKFQLAVESRDITTMRTPLGLVRMRSLPQGGTNSMAHIVNAMNKVPGDCIPDITMPFLDEIPIKGCRRTQRTRRLE